MRRRLRGLAVAGACGALLGTALWLHPQASLSGTHTQLGLSACPFLVHTGWPCPTCGMTTAVSLAAHGEILTSLHAQPLGLALLLGDVVLGLAAGLEAILGRPMLRRLRLDLWAWALLLAVPGVWAIRLAVGLATGSLPMR